MKKFIGLVIVLMLCSLAVFTSCDLFGGNPDPVTPVDPSVTPVDPPAAPASLTALADVEEVDVSWSASEGAVSYNLYYTNNGTAPAKTSTKITLGNVTSYSLSNLSGTVSSAATYIFAVTAVKDGAESSLSTPSSGVRPIPTFEVQFTGGTADSPMLLIVTPVNLDRTKTPPEFESFGDGVLYDGYRTDASGDAVLIAPFDRSKSVGYTLVYDNDDSGTLSDGDVVTGDGAADTWGVNYFYSIIEYSFIIAKGNADLDWHEYQP